MRLGLGGGDQQRQQQQLDEQRSSGAAHRQNANVGRRALRRCASGAEHRGPRSRWALLEGC